MMSNTFKTLESNPLKQIGYDKHYTEAKEWPLYYCTIHNSIACRGCWPDKCQCLVGLLRSRHYCPDCDTLVDCVEISGCTFPPEQRQPCKDCFDKRMVK